METIGISACLLGVHCKYNGAHNLNLNIIKHIKGKALILICPEVMGGLSTPRIPSEIQSNGRIVDQKGQDVTEAFELGANKSIQKLLDHQCKQVILKDGSPSCGYTFVYDGSFTGKTVSGEGVTCKKIKAHQIDVISIK